MDITHNTFLNTTRQESPANRAAHNRQMQIVSVSLGKRSYPIFIGSLTDTLPAALKQIKLTPKALLVSDETVGKLYAEQVRRLLENNGFTVRVAITPAGEQAKSLKIAGQLYNEAAAAGLDRNSLVVALGGGVIGDAAGFIAATYLRGVQFIQIPTTLLAQVDASVGGKVAINHPAGKNLIGAFYQPRAVLVDIAFFETLPPRDYYSGMAEVVKHALLDSEERLQWLEDNLDQLLSRDTDLLQQVVAWCCQYKAGVVMRDEREENERKYLNLGHTFGHAVEAWGGFSRWTHGESIAIGLIAALKLSVEKLNCPTTLIERVKTLLTSLNLPVELPSGEQYDLQPYLRQDKKSSNKKIFWVLLAAPGKAKLYAIDKDDDVCSRLC